MLVWFQIGTHYSDLKLLFKNESQFGSVEKLIAAEKNRCFGEDLL